MTECELFRQGLTKLVAREHTGPLHSPEDDTLPGRRGIERSIRVEAGRPLRQTGQKGGLRRREHGCGASEVRATGPLGPPDLIAVRRKVQVQREDFLLRVAMLDSQRQNRFVNLRRETAAPSARLLV